MNVYGTFGNELLLAPDLSEDLLAAQNSTAMIDQEAQQLGSFAARLMVLWFLENSMRAKSTAYPNYTYEIYGNPTLLGAGGSLTNWNSTNLTNMGWGALPFSLSQTGVINTNRFTASANNTLDVYLEEKAARGFYFVSFRVPGANAGTP